MASLVIVHPVIWLTLGPGILILPAARKAARRMILLKWLSIWAWFSRVSQSMLTQEYCAVVSYSQREQEGIIRTWELLSIAANTHWYQSVPIPKTEQFNLSASFLARWIIAISSIVRHHHP